MTPQEGDRSTICGGPAPLPWEYDCRVLEPTDVAGAVKLYGGRAKPVRAGFPYCPTLPTPPPATHATARAFPASSLATTAINWVDPPARSLQHVLVNRRPGSCATYPSVPGVSPIEIRPSGAPLRGTTIAYVAGRAGAQSALDSDRIDPGRWCYSVWTIGPKHRYTRSANAFVQIGTPPAAATSLALTATAALAPDIVAGATVAEVTLRFRLPPTPKVTAIRVERITGACPRAVDEPAGRARRGTRADAGRHRRHRQQRPDAGPVVLHRPDRPRGSRLRARARGGDRAGGPSRHPRGSRAVVPSRTDGTRAPTRHGGG